MEDHLILDIETAPLDMATYESLDEGERKRLLNPMDCKVVAIGLRHQGENSIFMGDDEREILTQFWNCFEEKRKGGTQIVGFNINQFDIPFLVVRSFMLKVKVVPFTLKYVVDLREKVNAYRYQPSRGTLKEFAAAMGLEDKGDGSQVPFLWKRKEVEKLREYLEHDLFITDSMFHRLKELRILDIQKW